MARYTDLRCGNCNYSFTGGYSVGRLSRLGPTRIKCPKCSSTNQTNSKPYSQFKLFDLLYFWTGRIISTIVLGALYGGLLAFIIGSFLGYYTQSFGLGGGLIGIIGNIIFNYYGIKHQIKKIEIEESEFETPEMEKERIKRAASKKLSRVDDLKNKLLETFPEYNPSKSYDIFDNNLFEMQRKHSRDFEILTWPMTKSCVDEDNKIYFENIALYIKKIDRIRFIEDKLNFNGPVYIKEDLAFDTTGKLLLYGYFEHSKTKELLKQAKDQLSSNSKNKSDIPYFVIN
jgi:hypothetical protein